MDNKDLKPMSIGDTLDATFKIYKDDFWRLIGAFGILYFPLTLILNFVGDPNIIDNFQTKMKDVTNFKDAVIQYQFIRDNMSQNFHLQGLLLMVLGFLVACIYVPAVFKIAAEAFNGNKVTILESYKYASNNVWSYIVTSIFAKLVELVIIVLMVIGLVVAYLIMFLSLGINPVKLMSAASVSTSSKAILIIATIVLALIAIFILAFVVLFNYFVTASFVIDGKKYGEAISSALKLACNKLWKYICSVIIMYVIIFLIWFVIGIIFALLGFSSDSLQAEVIKQAITEILLQPIILTLIVVLTYDYKIKKQGLDLQNDYLDLINKDKE